MSLEDVYRRGKQIRSVGFDDAPWRQLPAQCNPSFVGTICSNVRFEGMLWGTFTKDGTDITEKLVECLLASKFLQQLQVILLDGITFGGCNVVDLRQLSECTGLPAVTVMRRYPDLEQFREVVIARPNGQRRWESVENAGPIHNFSDFYFQVFGAHPDCVGPVLQRLTDQGKVPEPLRLAHLIGSAVLLGQSGKRA